MLLCLIWGSSWIVIQDGLARLPPLFGAGLRFLLAGVVMVAVSAALRGREGGEDPPTWLWLLIASSNFALSYGIIYIVQQTLPSGLVSVLWAVYPLMMAATGHLLLPSERLRRGQWFGFVLGFLGVALLFDIDLASLRAGRETALLLLLSPLCTAFGTTMLKRHGSTSSSLVLNRNAMLFGGILLLLGSKLTGEPLDFTLDTRALLGLLYLSVFGTVATLGLYYWVLRYVPANRLSLIAYVTPAIALLLGWAIAGEQVRASTLAGTAMIFAGIALANLLSRSRSKSARSNEALAKLREW